MAAAASRGLPKLHLGTMTFGWSQASSPVDVPVAGAMLALFQQHGGQLVDTARVYSGGASEQIVGAILEEQQAKKPKLEDGSCPPPPLVATKVNPMALSKEGGGLSAPNIRLQLEASLGAIGLPAVETLYLHQPDGQTALTETLACTHQLVQEGKVRQIGLSNYSVAETERCIALCQEHAGRLRLGQLLHKHSIRFVAYNPLAAGMLTGKHSKAGEVPSGRFKQNPNYLDRFYKDDCFEAVEQIKAACDQAGIGMVEAAYRWLNCHSALEPEDGLLLGASTVEQLEANLVACQHTQPLPQPVLDALDAAWQTTQPDAFAFWRSYSADQPGREQMDPGGSYVVKK